MFIDNRSTRERSLEARHLVFNQDTDGFDPLRSHHEIYAGSQKRKLILYKLRDKVNASCKKSSGD